MAVFATNISALTDRVIVLEGKATTDEADISTLEGNVTTLQGSAGNHNTRIGSLETSRTTDEATLSNHGTRVSSLESSRTADESRLTSLESSRTADESTLGTHTTTLSSHDTTLASHTDTLARTKKYRIGDELDFSWWHDTVLAQSSGTVTKTNDGITVSTSTAAGYYNILTRPASDLLSYQCLEVKILTAATVGTFIGFSTWPNTAKWNTLASRFGIELWNEWQIMAGMDETHFADIPTSAPAANDIFKIEMFNNTGTDTMYVSKNGTLIFSDTVLAYFSNAFPLVCVCGDSTLWPSGGSVGIKYLKYEYKYK